ncbi:hypothetical protein [Cohnella sp.]
MFSYGKDIPLDDVVSAEIADNQSEEAKSAEYLFTYGMDVFPDDGN